MGIFARIKRVKNKDKRRISDEVESFYKFLPNILLKSGIAILEQRQDGDENWTHINLTVGVHDHIYKFLIDYSYQDNEWKVGGIYPQEFSRFCRGLVFNRDSNITEQIASIIAQYIEYYEMWYDVQYYRGGLHWGESTVEFETKDSLIYALTMGDEFVGIGLNIFRGAYAGTYYLMQDEITKMGMPYTAMFPLNLPLYPRKGSTADIYIKSCPRARLKCSLECYNINGHIISQYEYEKKSHPIRVQADSSMARFMAWQTYFCAMQSLQSYIKCL